jgi:cytochrome c biogenesis protein CcmG/thiol:disulfide interchange protein DsbE
MTRWMRFLPLAVFIAIVAVAYVMLSASSEGTRDTKAIGFSMTNAPVPDLTLPKFEGNGTIALADYQGKAYAINIFASWCGPCKLEASSIEVMSEALPVIGINYRDNPEDAALFLEQFGNPYQALARDLEGNYSIQLGVHGLPETFIIAPDGTILHHQQGPVFASDLKGKLGQAIERALGS